MKSGPVARVSSAEEDAGLLGVVELWLPLVELLEVGVDDFPSEVLAGLLVVAAEEVSEPGRLRRNATVPPTAATNTNTTATLTPTMSPVRRGRGAGPGGPANGLVAGGPGCGATGFGTTGFGTTGFGGGHGGGAEDQPGAGIQAPIGGGAGAPAAST